MLFSQHATAFKLGRGVAVGVWAFVVLTLAHLADAISLNPAQGMLFALVCCLLSARIQSFVGLAVFMSSTVLLAHALSALQATSSSIEQFFPPTWGPLDTVLLFLMWLAPLVALMIVRCEYTIDQFIAVLVRWLLPHLITFVVRPAYQKIRSAFWNVEVGRSSLYRYRHLNRGPPSLVV